MVPLLQLLPLPITFCILACIALVGVILTVARWALYKAPSIETVTQTILQVPTYLANGLLSLLWSNTQDQQALEANQANLRNYAKYLMATFGPRTALPASPTYANHQMDWIPRFSSVSKLPTIPLVWVHRIALKRMPLMLAAPSTVEPAKKPKRSLFGKIWMTFRTIVEWIIIQPMVLFSSTIQWSILPILRTLSTWTIKTICTKAIPVILDLMVLVTPGILGCLLEAFLLFGILMEAFVRFVVLPLCTSRRHKHYNEIVECLQAIGLKPSDFGPHKSLDKQFTFLKKTYKNKCLDVHPDKGGTAEAFRKVNESFLRLKNIKENRQITTFCI